METQQEAVLIVAPPGAGRDAFATALRARGMAAVPVLPAAVRDDPAQPAPEGGLAVLDLAPDAHSDAATLVARLREAGWRVLLITDPDHEDQAAVGVAGGALGLVPRSAPLERLVDATVRAARGSYLLSLTERRRLQSLAGKSRV